LKDVRVCLEKGNKFEFSLVVAIIIQMGGNERIGCWEGVDESDSPIFCDFMD
jgi:hypothetical protein